MGHSVPARRLFSSLTVRQNIQFPLREIWWLSDALIDEIATASSKMVGLRPEDAQVSFRIIRRHDQARGAWPARSRSIPHRVLRRAIGLDPIAAGDFDALIKTLQKHWG